MSIANLITENLIAPSLQGKDKYQVIEELLDLLVEDGDVGNREVALNDLIEREHYLSTGLEKGLAVPHAKSTAVEKLVVSLGISEQGVDFDSLDGEPANCIFLVLSPRDISGPHIKILAQITRNFRDGEIGHQLKNAKTKKDILKIIEDFK